MTKIMLLEDDKTMLSLLSTLLTFEGFEIVQIKNDQKLDDILVTIQNEAPSLIMLDINLSQFNGFDLLRRIRQNETRYNTKVLVASGLDFRIECRQEGADNFIQKPFMPEELIAKIHETLPDETRKNN
jgi:DNA-binding response OmpR family regulator